MFPKIFTEKMLSFSSHYRAKSAREIVDGGMHRIYGDFVPRFDQF